MPASTSSASARSIAPSALLRVAIAFLVALALLSIALPLLGPAHGIGLAIAKVALIAFVASRVWRADVYALQWSSMLILLFIAEGIVRAMTDPSPASWLGGLAVVAGGGYFVAVLAYLRPVKKAARAAP